MKAVVFTLGCKVNECESHSLATGLTNLGYQVTDKLEPADLYIVNTCAVTQEAEKKSRQTASRIKKLNPNAKIIWTGCATQKDATAFENKSKDGLITGVFEKGKILEMLSNSGNCVAQSSLEFEELLPVKTLKTRTFVKVQDGCNNFCSYCIIPYLRGRNRARNPQNVVKEIETVKPLEAVITGINLSAYDYDGITLSGLITSLKDQDCRIRLGSLEVNVIDDEFLTALKNLKNFAPHFHLSLQSGSNDVLKSMNRHYTREQFLEKVNLIREYFPNAGITTDVIAGFPTETEKDFLDTIDLIKKVNFSDIHPFTFSPRSGTVAYKMQDLNGQIKKARLEQLLELKESLKKDFSRSQVGKTLDWLPEEMVGDYTVGYNENYLRVYVKGDYTNKGIIKVKVIEPYLDGAIAQIL